MKGIPNKIYLALNSNQATKEDFNDLNHALINWKLWRENVNDIKYVLQPEMVKCECGHIVPLKFSVSNTEDGNATCMPCLVAELESTINQLKIEIREK